MSLPEAYRLAHSAECRLNMEAGRKDRNLRFLVGHLMHYENLRLRIVEIEHDISKSHRAKAVQFQGTGQLRHKPSTGQLGRKSPPPSQIPGLDHDDEDDLSDGDDDVDEDDEDVAGLGLQRFPSGSARPPPLEPDDDDDIDEDDDEPVSPTEPDQATLDQAMKGDGNAELAKMYNGVRKCPCHGKTDAPEFDRVWELPGQKGSRDGVTVAVAEVRAGG